MPFNYICEILGVTPQFDDVENGAHFAHLHFASKQGKEGYFHSIPFWLTDKI